MLSLDHVPVPVASVIGQVIEAESSPRAEAVLVLTDVGQVKVLNEVGARIWSLADGTRRVRDIAAAVSAEYQVSQEQAEQDTLEFIGELVARGIISVSERTAQPPFAA